MPIKTPTCDFGQAAKSFELKSTNNEIINLNDVKVSPNKFIFSTLFFLCFVYLIKIFFSHKVQLCFLKK